MALNFEDIHDPRRSKSVTYPLGEIFFISLCAMLSGADAFTEFQAYGLAQESWLKKRLPLVNGTPSHDTFRAVFGLIAPNSFNQFFMRWTQGLRKLDGHDLIAVDGKSLRGSSREQAVHLVNAWASGDNLILGQMKTDKKSNEITAIPQLLEQLELKGAIVTIDAMGTQKTIARTIEEAGASYVLCLKNNHPKLHRDVEEFMENPCNAGLMDFHEHSGKDHGRQSTWRYSIAECPDWLPERSEWTGLCALGRVERIREIEGGQRKSTLHYYVCSIEADADLFGSCVGSHWGVENKAHWVLDVTFNEDACQVRNDVAATNLSLMRKLCINLLRQDPSKRSLREKRKVAGWNSRFLEEILGLTHA